VERDEYL